MTPEGKIKKAIDGYLKTLGDDWWGFKPMMMGYGRKGIPDIIGCYKGRFVAIEVKAAFGTSTPWQVREAYAIQNALGVCGVCRSVGDVISLLNSLENE